MKTKLYIASFGGGTNSTAWMTRWVELGLPLHLILFADTGAERPETYCHIEKFSHWLAKQGYPEIITVKRTDKNGIEETLEEELLRDGRLPSPAYGFQKHTCSHKYKQTPQNKFINNWEPAKETWKRGEKIIKLIGYDFGEEHRVLRAIHENKGNKKYDLNFPLYHWKWKRSDCVAAIETAGIKQPGKSSCFYCPSMKKDEIQDLRHKYPDLFHRAINLERSAKPNLKSIKGLGCEWSWESFAKQGEMFPELFPEPRASEICCDCYDG